jgi:hypothetical protein
MPRSVSIHVGVNEPGGGCVGQPVLAHSEETAGKMAGLAIRAGYDSVLMLRGPEATRQVVQEALAGAADTLVGGDVLLVSFSGHGEQVADHDRDERKGLDETWCLHDGSLLDDELVDHWRAFRSGVRILVVAESCHAGGCVRGFDPPAARRRRSPLGRGGWEAPPGRGGRRSAAETAGSFVVRPPEDADGIRASVLLLAACNEHRPTRAGVFARHLFAIWADGAYRGSYRELYLELKRRMSADSLEPHILMLGVPDPDFLLEPAFHRDEEAAGPRGAWV